MKKIEKELYSNNTHTPKIIDKGVRPRVYEAINKTNTAQEVESLSKKNKNSEKHDFGLFLERLNEDIKNREDKKSKVLEEQRLREEEEIQKLQVSRFKARKYVRPKSYLTNDLTAQSANSWTESMGSVNQTRSDSMVTSSQVSEYYDSGRRADPEDGKIFLDNNICVNLVWK